MDAGRPRRLAWRRRRRTGMDAGLPALDRLAARARGGTIGERLSGTGAYSQRWAGACPPRQLRNRDKCDQAPSPMNYMEIGRGRSTMNVARWIVQGLLAALFLFAG